MNAIPAVVAKVFETHSVDYASMSQTRIFQYMHNLSVSKTPQNSQTKSAPVVQIVFLEDENGRAQVLIPRDRLLDLSSMSNRLGRQFKAMQPKDMDAFKLKYNVSDMPPIPEITELETFVDRSLLTHHFLYIFSGTQDHWLKISNKSFTHLINGANIGVFAVSAPRLEPFDSQSMQILADESDLQDDIKDINHAVERFTARRIHQRLEETLDLPPLPETARRIVEIRIDPDADTLQLATAVEFDPTLSAQVMSWARSPYYASRDIATDIQSAVLRVLGFDLVVNLALGLSLGRALTLPKDGPHGYTPFWQQAVVTATLCNELARTIATNKRPDVGLAYLCGLLHNFGYLILGHVFPPQFELVNRYIEANPHIGRHQLEMYLLGITREQCAAALLKQWGMPAELIIATRYQHHEHLNMSNDDANLKYAQLLYVATRLLRQRGFGDGPNQAIDANVWQALGLDEVLAQSITDETLNRLEDLNVQVSVLNQATSR